MARSQHNTEGELGSPVLKYGVEKPASDFSRSVLNYTWSQSLVKNPIGDSCYK